MTLSSNGCRSRQVSLATETRYRLGETIGLGAGTYAILVQALVACAAQSLLALAPVEP
jgi:hypothetical protein